MPINGRRTCPSLMNLAACWVDVGLQVAQAAVKHLVEFFSASVVTHGKDGGRGFKELLFFYICVESFVGQTMLCMMPSSPQLLHTMDLEQSIDQQPSLWEEGLLFRLRITFTSFHFLMVQQPTCPQSSAMTAEKADSSFLPSPTCCHPHNKNNSNNSHNIAPISLLTFSKFSNCQKQLCSQMNMEF